MTVFFESMCQMTFFSLFGERSESKKVTLKMSHLEREAPDWLNVSFLFVQASCLGEW